MPVQKGDELSSVMGSTPDPTKCQVTSMKHKYRTVQNNLLLFSKKKQQNFANYKR